MLGTNDAQTGYWNEAEFTSSLTQLTRKLMSDFPRASVLLAVPSPIQPGGSFAISFDANAVNSTLPRIIPQVAASLGVTCIDVFSAFGGACAAPGLLDQDGVHLSQAGYQKVASVMVDQVLQTVGSGTSSAGIYASNEMQSGQTLSQNTSQLYPSGVSSLAPQYSSSVAPQYSSSVAGFSSSWNQPSAFSAATLSTPTYSTVASTAAEALPAISSQVGYAGSSRWSARGNTYGGSVALPMSSSVPYGGSSGGISTYGGSSSLYHSSLSGMGSSTYGGSTTLPSSLASPSYGASGLYQSSLQPMRCR